MKAIQLVRLDPAIDESLYGDPLFLEAMMGEDWVRVAAMVHDRVGQTLTAEPESVDELAWGGYYVVDTTTREFIGSCAYKGEPDGDGCVEIAYFTYPGFEGQGYATSMASKLIEMAAGSAAVHRLIAHTRPEKNASTRVLEKAGMRFEGEVIDPEDGRVWRWQKEAHA